MTGVEGQRTVFRNRTIHIFQPVQFVFSIKNANGHYCLLTSMYRERVYAYKHTQNI